MAWEVSAILGAPATGREQVAVLAQELGWGPRLVAMRLPWGRRSAHPRVVRAGLRPARFSGQYLRRLVGRGPRGGQRQVDRRSSVLWHLVKQNGLPCFVMSLGCDQQVGQGGLFIASLTWAPGPRGQPLMASATSPPPTPPSRGDGPRLGR